MFNKMKIQNFKGFVLDKQDNRNGSIETFVGEDGVLIQGYHNPSDIHIKPFIYETKEGFATLNKTLRMYNKSKKRLEQYYGTR